MITYVEINSIDVTSYVLSWECYEEWKVAISEATIKLSPSVTNVVTLDAGLSVLIKRGFSSVEEDYVIRGQITQVKPTIDNIQLVVKGKMYEAIKSAQTVSYDINIDTQAGVASEIFKALCDNAVLSYTPEAGNTSDGTIVCTGTTAPYLIEKYIQNGEDDFQKMNELAELYNFIIWFDNKLEYVHFEPAGYTTYAHTLVVGTDITTQIKWKINMEQLINKVRIEGATVYDTIVESFAGPATTFTLSKSPENTEVRDTNASGTLYTRGQQNVGTIGTDFDYYVDVELKTVTFSGATSNVWIKYGTQVPMPVELSNLISIEQYGGINKTPHFKKFTFTDVKNIADAEARGRAILAKYSTPFIEAQDIPISDSTIETYGYIKAGDLVQIEDSFTNQSYTTFVKIVKKTYPEPLDKITIGDEIWRTEDWQKVQMEKINRLLNELNKNENILIQISDFPTDVTFENRYAQLQSTNISDGFIIGHYAYGILGTSEVGEGTISPAVIRIVQGNNTYKEYFYDIDFKSSATANWDTSSKTLIFTAGQDAISSVIHKNLTTIYRAKMIVTVSAGSLSDLTLYMRVDGVNWETATDSTFLTFSHTGTELDWKIVSAGNVTVNYIEIQIQEVTT